MTEMQHTGATHVVHLVIQRCYSRRGWLGSINRCLGPSSKQAFVCLFLPFRNILSFFLSFFLSFLPREVVCARACLTPLR